MITSTMDYVILAIVGIGAILGFSPILMGLLRKLPNPNPNPIIPPPPNPSNLSPIPPPIVSTFNNEVYNAYMVLYEKCKNCEDTREIFDKLWLHLKPTI